MLFVCFFEIYCYFQRIPMLFYFVFDAKYSRAPICANVQKISAVKNI